MDITEQPQEESHAVIRTNMRNAIKRVRDLKAEHDKILQQLKMGITTETARKACGEQYDAFTEAINDLY